jgi:hypothetical protein
MISSARFTDQPRQALRTAITRDQAELDLGQSEPRAARGQPKCAGERQFEPAAERISVDQRNRRDRQRVEPVENRLPEGGALTLSPQRAAHQLLDVGPGAKGSVAGAGHQQRTGIASRHLVERCAEVAEQFEIERVQHLRPIERDEGQLVDARQMQCHPIGVGWPSPGAIADRRASRPGGRAA